MDQAAPTNPRTPAFCRRCDYDLSDSLAGPCPECSRPFDPADPRTFFRSARARRLRAWRRRAAWALVGLVVFGLFAPRGFVTTRLTWTVTPSPALGATAPAPTTFSWTETRIHLIPPTWLGPSGLGLRRYPWWTFVQGTPAPAPGPGDGAASFGLRVVASSWNWHASPAGSLGGMASWTTGETMLINSVPLDPQRSSDMMNALAETYFTGGGAISVVSPQTQATPSPVDAASGPAEPIDR